MLDNLITHFFEVGKQKYTNVNPRSESINIKKKVEVPTSCKLSTMSYNW